jgi:hypothetical protein
MGECALQAQAPRAEVSGVAAMAVAQSTDRRPAAMTGRENWLNMKKAFLLSNQENT